MARALARIVSPLSAAVIVSCLPVMSGRPYRARNLSGTLSNARIALFGRQTDSPSKSIRSTLCKMAVNTASASARARFWPTHP
jgi:hypothetical protein